MNTQAIEDTARTPADGDKGLLAMDEDARLLGRRKAKLLKDGSKKFRATRNNVKTRIKIQ